MGKERHIVNQLPTTSQDALKRVTKVEEFNDLLKDQIRVFDKAKDSNFYFYSPDIDTTLDSAPHLFWDTVRVFYIKAESDCENFSKNTFQLRHEGIKRSESNLSIDEAVRSGEALLTSIYSLVATIEGISSTQASPPKLKYYLSSLQQIEINKIIEEVNNIGLLQSENFFETMRMYLPRFITYPISVPNEFTQHIEPSLLFSSEHQRKQTLPLHQILEGRNAYALQVQAIENILEMERTRSSEIPYFSYIFPALCIGEKRIIPKHCFFDYKSSVLKLMNETFDRFQEEIKEDEDGPASHFLAKLEAFYPDYFPDIFFRSFLLQTTQSNLTEQFDLLRTLEGKMPEFTERLSRPFINAPERPAFYTVEIETLLENFTNHSLFKTISPEEQIGLCEKILGDEDRYEYRIQLRKLGINIPGKKIEIELELDALSEMINGVMYVEDDDVRRSISFQESFSGEKESFEIITVDDNDCNDSTLITINNIVLLTLLNESKKIITQQDNSPGNFYSERNTLRTKDLSREERKKLYLANKTDKLNIPPAKIPKIETKNEVKGQPKVSNDTRVIDDLTVETVEEFLKDENIQLISAEKVVQKLLHSVQMVNNNQKILGKPLNGDFLGKLKEEVRLREIRWKVGSNALRIYLEDAGDGHFTLRGIQVKKSNSQQQRFIEKIFAKMIKEKIDSRRG